MTPPDAISLICVAPRRSCSRAARRTSVHAIDHLVAGDQARDGLAVVQGLVPLPVIGVAAGLRDGRAGGQDARPTERAGLDRMGPGRFQAASITDGGEALLQRCPSMNCATASTCMIQVSVPWSPLAPMSAKCTCASVRPGSSVQPAPSTPRHHPRDHH